MELVGANPAPRIRGTKPLPERSHYLIGNDPQQWRTHIRHYAGVRYQQVYPGVDLVCYGSDRRLEYDFVISPGGEPSSIRLAFEGADSLSVDPTGDLVVEISGEQLRHRKPRIYQVAGDRRQSVQGGFVLAGQAEVAFWVGAYDPARTLVIDPVLDYSTYVGGSFGDDNPSLTVDRFGNAFVIAEVFSADFPTTDGVFQPAHQNDSEPEDANDIAIFKLNAIGSALIYSTFLGGSGQELSGCKGAAIAVDGAGNVYVSGRTESADFPTTAGAFDRTLNGAFDTFVAKLDPDGANLLYSTFLGGVDEDRDACIAVDEMGYAVVSGETASAGFPTTPTGFDTTHNGGGRDIFVSKLRLEGNGADDLVYSTFLGGLDEDTDPSHVLDSSGMVYLVGRDGVGELPDDARRL